MKLQFNFKISNIEYHIHLFVNHLNPATGKLTLPHKIHSGLTHHTIADISDSSLFIGVAPNYAGYAHT